LKGSQLLSQVVQRVKQVQDPNQRLQIFERVRPELQKFGVELPPNLTLESVTDQGLIPLETGLGQTIQQLTAGQIERREASEALSGAIDPQTGQLFKDPARMTPQGRAEAIKRKLIPGAGTFTAPERQALSPELGEDVTKLEANREKQKALAKDAAGLSTEIFQRVGSIEENISNMEEGIRLIDAGAATGPVEKWLPSFRAATVKLENLKNRLGLDVIGQVTFGALSESELRVAFDTAVPANLRGEALKEWFQERIENQTKLLNALEDAGIFLAEEGNNIPKLMAKRRKDRTAGRDSRPAQEAQEGEVMVDANGNRALVFPDGTFREL
jgi:hypothetical protein